MVSHKKAQKDITGVTVWTVGHSTRSGEEFGQILLAHEIEVLVDVRSFPGSRRYPQFNRSALAESLGSIGIKYRHESRLGGRRTPRADSHNTAWRNSSFRAYADHMETDDFRKGVEDLLELAATARVAVMCAEALWWRCHRSLISDYLKATGHTVVHIVDQTKTEEHLFTSAARIVDGELTYRGLL
ncbi:MAG TPA: DUF488 domain-containing protein [Pyrinomonadaceae bacterium]|nr:DUF488 domain-containing protein [Pyrinomonadaceae bacterium]